MNLHFGDDKPSLESLTLTHQDTTNMKWGQSKQKQLDYHNKVASGKGSHLTNLNYKLRVATIPQLVKHDGDVKKIAAENAATLQTQKDRIQSGNAPVVDLVRRK